MSDFEKCQIVALSGLTLPENLWSIFDEKLKNRNPNKEIKLIIILNDCWPELSHNPCQSFIETMTKRYQQGIKSNREPNKYEMVVNFIIYH